MLSSGKVRKLTPCLERAEENLNRLGSTRTPNWPGACAKVKTRCVFLFSSLLFVGLEGKAKETTWIASGCFSPSALPQKPATVTEKAATWLSRHTKTPFGLAHSRNPPAARLTTNTKTSQVTTPKPRCVRPNSICFLRA